MARYLLELAYTPEAWAAQLESPQNRMEAVKPVLDSLGARFECMYYAFGEHDLIGIVEAPDNMSAAAASIAFSAGGALKSVRTTPLMTVEEGMETLRKGYRAFQVYKPPSGRTATAKTGQPVKQN
ncbi:MAG TPA: GYD domain-containing protein [Candidatus Limnocylindria bacterium]|jgi:uncharacterized protein with GYD domain|nr:GYD domain-containing protein [Candidatus Limnocylindria bacterium]